MNMKSNGYYLIRNVVNNIVYVGSTRFSFDVRWRNHKHHLRNGNHTNKHLQREWNEYGEFSFRFEIISEGYKGREAESDYIREYAPNCYNTDIPTTSYYRPYPDFMFQHPRKGNGYLKDLAERVKK